MKTITMAGSVITDVIKTVDAYPQKGGITAITSVRRCVGGAVANTGVDLKSLDENIKVIAVGKIGKDENGEFMKNELTSRGLEVYFSESDTLPTSFTDVISETGGERTFFTQSGASFEFSPADIPTKAEECDIFHLGYLTLLAKMDETDDEYGTVAARYLAGLQKKGVKTSIDMVTTLGESARKILRCALPYVNYIVVNELEAQEITEITLREKGKLVKENLQKAIDKLFELGVCDVAVIHCPELGCGRKSNGEFTIVPSLQLPNGYIKGSVGAGDAFCAGMLYSFLSELSLEEGLKLASLAAACNLSSVNSIDGARSLEKTLELEKIYSRREI
jgi:sugar/nucleoside kinase (ribokinase family)